MNKKGFTLVELLAVIVILAVVMLIAVTAVGPMMEKSRKSSLGNEGIAAIKASETAYEAETIKGNSASYKSTSTVCYSIAYLCDKGYFEKGCTGSGDGYTGSVLVEYTGNGQHNYTFWLSNGTYTYNAADKSTYGDVENATIIYDGHEASQDCGKTMPEGSSEASINESKKIMLRISDKNSGEIVACRNICEEESYTAGPKQISFTINGTSYTTTEGQTWGEWILSTGGSSTGNGILWVSVTAGFSDADIASNANFKSGGVWYNYRRDTRANGRYIMLYMDKASYTYGLPNEDFVKWNGTGTTVQLYSTVIEDGGEYGGYNYISDKYYCCFDAGTKITMANGTQKNIEDIKAGDIVMSYNESTNKFEAKKVSKTIVKHNSDDLVYIHLSDGTKIGMRAYHPLLTTDGYKSLRPEMAETVMEVGYKVSKLEIGDTIVGINGTAKVVAIETRKDVENYDTYNFTVEDNHNYIANGFVAHNAKC